MHEPVIESDGTEPVAPSQAAALQSPPSPSPVSVSPVRRWLREPMVHFLPIGLALFAAYRVWQPGPDAGTVSRRVELTEDALRQMTVAWLAQGRPPVTQEQMRSLVEQGPGGRKLLRAAGGAVALAGVFFIWRAVA